MLFNIISWRNVGWMDVNFLKFLVSALHMCKLVSCRDILFYFHIWFTHGRLDMSLVAPQKQPGFLTLWSRALVQFRKEVTIFFTRAHIFSLFWTRLDQSTPFHPISLWYTSIFFSIPHVSIASGLFPSGVTTKSLNAFIFLPVCSTTSASHVLLDLIALLKLLRSSNNKEPAYVIFSRILLFPPL